MAIGTLQIVAGSYLAIRTQFGRDVIHRTGTHPSLFTLPEDAPFPGQRQDAIDAIIDGLDKIGAPRDCFKSFGIDPSDATPAS
jgi:hypothetical protein